MDRHRLDTEIAASGTRFGERGRTDFIVFADCL
jgi:hypothetical protein